MGDRWPAARRAAEDRRLLEDALDALETAGCVFQSCEGPTPRPAPMVTCTVCRTIGQLRRRLGLPVRRGVEGAVPIKAERRDADLRRATAGPSPDGVTSIGMSFHDDRRWMS